VGPGACASCHPAAVAAWNASKHRQAYADLAGRRKQYALACVACHVEGWQRPSGVCRIDRTEGHDFVGCESCHGPGSLHVASGGHEATARPDAATCRTCHDLENSPHFDVATYLLQILVPGHGAPPTRRHSGEDPMRRADGGPER
jgi:hypothetical protein